MNNLSPFDVSTFVSFVQGDKEWSYKAQSKSMESLQAEGVAGLYNRLSKYSVALLADEVGTGKTFQALVLASIFMHQNPGFRVLILAPRQAVANQWPGEFSTLQKFHFKKEFEEKFSDFYIPVLERLHCNGDPKCVAEDFWVRNNGESNTAIVKLQNAQLIVAKFSSFSYLKSTEDEGGMLYNKRIEEIEEQLGLDEIDLVIVDEAHYFRNTGSNRYEAAKTIFEKMPDAKFLLMTATPNHSSNQDIISMLSVTGKLKQSDEHSYVLKGANEYAFEKNDAHIGLLDLLAIRRYRRLTTEGYIKRQYRKGKSIRCSFSENPDSELFYAMYQRQLVHCAEINHHRTRGNLKKYLEGIEFSPALYRKENTKKSDKDHQANDYSEGYDQAILNKLIDCYQKTIGKNDNHTPSNPKYIATVDKIWNLIWPSDQSVSPEKVLVFSRRIASTRELSSQILHKYDQEFWKMLLEALDLNSDPPMPRSREEFNAFMKRHSGIELSEDGEVEDDLDASLDIEDELPSDSVVLSWFRRERSNANKEKSTPASRFRRLFDMSQSRVSPFKDFFDPSKDQSLLTILQLSDEWDNEKKANLLALLRKSILQASIGVVELYCCYLRVNRERKADYQDFFLEVKKTWNTLRVRHDVEKMLQQYDVYCEKFIEASDRRISSKIEEGSTPTFDWNMFNAASPAYPYTADTKNESVIKRFNAPFFPKVLVSTSVLQEGVNLQLNCKTVMHYGHAWTPGDDEQRIGRVDRIHGQIARELENDENANLEIYYPYLANTHDESSLKGFLRNKLEVERQIDRLMISDATVEDNPEDVYTNIETHLQMPEKNTKIDIEDPFPAIEGL